MTRPVVEELTVVCYDIADDRRRRQVVRVLEGFGVRVQESVFECWLTPRERRELKARLQRLIEAVEDRIGIYTLTDRDAADVITLGIGGGLIDNPGCYVA